MHRNYIAIRFADIVKNNDVFNARDIAVAHAVHSNTKGFSTMPCSHTVYVLGTMVEGVVHESMFAMTCLMRV